MIRRSKPPIFREPLAQDLPYDILPPILAQLSDRRDWHACALVSKVFNRAATPLLYRTLDSRVSKSIVHHPSATLLQRPDLAQYVRHVTETGGVHRSSLVRYPHITEDTLKALSLCKNLQSMIWTDDSSTSHTTLLSFLAAIRPHPLREITIRTHNDLGEVVWSELITLTGLRKISIWCMEGPPRVLQGWSESLGDTLTHLELGRCSGVPPTILISVLSQLPKLKDLRLKGAPATAIPTILTYLLDLRSLDTEYPGAHYARANRSIRNGALPPPPPLPALRQLTVRTSSIDSLGPQKLWSWIRELVPQPGLETFKLYAFTTNLSNTTIPRWFILDLARVHGETLKHFMVGDTQLTLEDIACLCSMFSKLETLVCSVASPDVESIVSSISKASNLRTMRLYVQWIPRYRETDPLNQFTLQHARDLMLRNEHPRLRIIAFGYTLYTGKWILREPQDEDEESTLEFQVLADVAEDKWQI